MMCAGTRTARWAVPVVIGLVAATGCGQTSPPTSQEPSTSSAPTSQETQQGDLVLATHPAVGPSENQTEPAWGGKLTEKGGCVVAQAGKSTFVVSAPEGSSVTHGGEDGKLALSVGGGVYPFGAEYKGGGTTLEDETDSADYSATEKSCVASSNADGVVRFQTIEPA